MISSILQQLEDKVSSPLTKLARSEAARVATGTKYWKDLGLTADTLQKLSSKDMSKDGNEAAYGMCLF